MSLHTQPLLRPHPSLHHSPGLLPGGATRTVGRAGRPSIRSNHPASFTYTSSMRLRVAEKPSVGRDTAGALGRHRREKGALVGDGWTVTWALGHLAELAPPDAYGEEYKR